MVSIDGYECVWSTLPGICGYVAQTSVPTDMVSESDELLPFPTILTRGTSGKRSSDEDAEDVAFL